MYLGLKLYTMKQLIKITLVVIVLATLSFTKAPGDHLTGTYGVSKNDPSCIALSLKEDHTFTYRDLSEPVKPIHVSGNWEVKGKYVVLKNTGPACSFHHKWKISEDGVVAKSRKGMTFYTLNKFETK